MHEHVFEPPSHDSIALFVVLQVVMSLSLVVVHWHMCIHTSHMCMYVFMPIKEWISLPIMCRCFHPSHLSFRKAKMPVKHVSATFGFTAPPPPRPRKAKTCKNGGCTPTSWASELGALRLHTLETTVGLMLVASKVQFFIPFPDIVRDFGDSTIAAKIITKKHLYKENASAQFIRINYKKSLHKANSLAYFLQNGTHQWQQHYKENLLVELFL